MRVASTKKRAGTPGRGGLYVFSCLLPFRVHLLKRESRFALQKKKCGSEKKGEEKKNLLLHARSAEEQHSHRSRKVLLVSARDEKTEKLAGREHRELDKR